MVFDFTVGKFRSLLLKVRSGTLYAQWAWHILPVPALWKATSTIPMDKKLGQLK